MPCVLILYAGICEANGLFYLDEAIKPIDVRWVFCFGNMHQHIPKTKG